MNKLIAAIAAALVATAPAAGQPLPQPSTGATGLWINPRGSVKVATGPCGGGLCGWVVWASAAAAADARDGGVPRLIGLELLRDYRGAGSGRYHGTVYVPDMGRSFASTIDQLGPDQLKISGCVLGGLLCRSQVWRRA